MAQRYLFLCADARKASGGVAVIYRFAETLREMGYEAAVLHQGRAASHMAGRSDVPVLHTSAIDRIRARRMRPSKRLMRTIHRLPDRLAARRPDEAPLSGRDVIVTSEFKYHEAIEAFPDNPIVVLSQNSFSYLASCARAIARGHDPATRAAYNIAIADICEDAFELTGAAPVARIPVSPDPETFPFVEEKEPLIAYMPRKRPAEALIVARALERRGRLGGHRLLEIDGMPHAEVRKALGRARFFLSFMRTEALGFPAAEAMASGCVAVGYTGLGTREYFHEGTGIPVAEGDTMALVEAIEGAVAEWEADPARLDALRREGCRTVHARYGRDVFEAAVAREWPRIDAAVARESVL
jgi:hypothetical protein